MSNPYRELFQAPGAAAFVAACAVARLALPMIGIGIITMLSQVRGAYTLAGAVAATFALATALLAPRISRLVDRHGQGRILPLATGACVAGLAGLAACVRLQAPDWTLFVFAALAGSLPSMPAMARARWTEIYRDRPQLRTAYALESVFDELSFIIGPPLAVGLCVILFPEAGPLGAALLLGLGVTAFVLQRATAPAVQPREAGRESSVLGVPLMRQLTAMMAAMGVIVGTIDVMSVAFARQQGLPAGASVVLSAYALGSCVAGLAFGVLKFQMPLARMLAIAASVTAFTTLPLLWVGDLLTLSLGVLLAGLSFAPTMIIAMAMVEGSVPGRRLTEGLTWLVTGLGAGVAAGAALAGWIVDRHGVGAGFWTAAGAGAVVLLVAGYAARGARPATAASIRSTIMSRTVVNPDTVFNTVQYGFSQAVIVTGQRRMLLSGQVGVDAQERTVGPGLREQTDAALDNIGRVLAAAGGTLAQVIMLRIYICETAREDQEAIAQALRDRFPVDPPPSSWIIVSGLSLPEWLVEIEAEAMLD